MKITKYLVSMAAALGMIAGCYKPEMIQVSAPEDVIAPVLEAVEGPIEITAENMANGSVEFKWSLADYGVRTEVSYAIEVANASAKATITSGITADTTAMNANKLVTSVAYETLNQILFNDLKLADGIAEEVAFTVVASVGEYPAVYSNSVKVSAKVTAAEKVYPKLYIVGSYNGWSHDSNQYIFDFDGADAQYSGVVDFGEDHASNEFKITAGGWGNDEHSMDGAHDAEASVVTVTDGGGDNINVFQAKRYYSLTYDRAAHTLTKNFSFDQLGVIGDFNGWGDDVVMSFNTAKQRFYADVEFPADGGFKFRADAGWDVNWGVAGGVLAAGADNIAVAAGKYRVYVNMNNPAEMTFELNAKAYGTEEGTAAPTPEPEPEPEPAVQGWGLVGEFNSWGGSADLMLTSDGNYLVAKGVSIEGQFKFRKDADWAVNFGATGDVEPFELTANVETELAAGGKNMVLPAGTFDIYFDEANAKAWFINDGSYPGGGAAPEASEWGVVGQVNSWGGSPDIVMYKTATEGLFVAKSVAMPDGGFKIRANNAWNDDANYGLATAGAVEVDHVYDVITGGGSGDMTLVAGTYDIWFDRTNEKVYIMTPGKAISEAVGGEATTPEQPEQPETPASDVWYLVGGFNGWTAADAAYQMTKSGDWFVFENFTLAEDAEVKFVADANWSVNRGGAYAAGEAIALEQNGSNLVVPAGTYDVYLSADATTAYFMAPGEAPALPDTAANTWYLVGGFNGWTAGDAAYQMTYEAGWHVFKNFTLAEASEVKLNAGSWDVNRGGTFAAVGEAIAVEHNGANIAVPAGSYDVYLNKAEDTLYFMTPGATPAN